MHFQLQGCAGIIRSAEKGARIVTVFVASTVLLPLVPTKYAPYVQLSGGYAWVGPSGGAACTFLSRFPRKTIKFMFILNYGTSMGMVSFLKICIPPHTHTWKARARNRRAAEIGGAKRPG